MNSPAGLDPVSPATLLSPAKRRRLALALAAIHLVAAQGCGSPDTLPADASVDALVAWAGDRAESGDLQRATEAYRRALARDSLRVEALTGLARVYDLQEMAGPADRYRRRAFHICYGEGLQRLDGKPDSARASFRRALAIMPRHPLGHIRLGEIEQAAGQLDSAIAHYERAVTANPRYSESLMALAKARVMAGQSGAAREAFERAIEANINAVGAYIGLGDLLAAEEDWARAAAQYDKALLIDPMSEDALLGLEAARGRL